MDGKLWHEREERDKAHRRHARPAAPSPGHGPGDPRPGRGRAWSRRAPGISPGRAAPRGGTGRCPWPFGGCGHGRGHQGTGRAGLAVAGGCTRPAPSVRPGPVQPDGHDDGGGKLDVQRQPGRLQILQDRQVGEHGERERDAYRFARDRQLGAKPDYEGDQADHGGGGHQRHPAVADGEVAEQHQEREPEVEAVLDGATGRQAVTGGFQHTGREKLAAGREERRKQVRVVAGQAGQDVHRPGGPVRARDQQPDRIPGDQQEDRQRRGQPARQRTEPAPARRGGYRKASHASPATAIIVLVRSISGDIRYCSAATSPSSRPLRSGDLLRLTSQSSSSGMNSGTSGTKLRKMCRTACPARYGREGEQQAAAEGRRPPRGVPAQDPEHRCPGGRQAQLEQQVERGDRPGQQSDGHAEDAEQRHGGVDCQVRAPRRIEILREERVEPVRQRM